MTDTIDIKSRPQLPGTPPQAALQVQARQQQWNGPAPAGNADLQGLVEGLSSFNPALRQLTANANALEIQRQADAAREDRKNGAAFAQGVENPRAVLTGQPIEGPSPLPVAVSDTFTSTMREQLAQRAGIQNKDEALTNFAAQKDQPDFNVDQWLQTTRAKALQGITDPGAATIVGHHLSEMEAEVRGVNRATQLKQAQEVATSTVTQQAADMFSTDMTPSAVYSAYPAFLARARGAGFTPKESAGFLFSRLVDNSNKLGGMPELFDVFDQKDSEGMTLEARNPHLLGAVTEARKQARAMREKSLGEAAEQGNAKLLMQLDLDLAEHPETVTPDRILSLLTPHGAIRSPDQAASIFMRARDGVMKAAATRQLLGLFDAGELWRLPSGEQNRVLESRLGGAVNMLAQANKEGDSDMAAQVGGLIMQVHSRSGATVPFDPLKNYLSTLTTTLQNKAGPSPAFTTAASIYKAMSGNPQYRSLYFGEEVSKVLGAFVDANSNGTDIKTAYEQAYQATSPEAKAEADAYVKTPEFQKVIKADAAKYVAGSSWWPRMLGGNGRAENQSAVGAWLTGEMRSWRTRNPFSTDKDAAEFAQNVTMKNWVIDSTTGSAVKVSPEISSQAAQEAISEHSKELIKRLRLGDRHDANWRVQYIPMGSGADYSAVAFDGASTVALGPVNLANLIVKQQTRRLLSDEERVTLGGMEQGLKAGEVRPVASELLAKAQAIGALNPTVVQTYRDAAVKMFRDRINSIPSMGEAPTFDAIPYSSRTGKVDRSLTSSTALQMAASPVYSSGDVHRSLAASLITMGEGVSLTAYDDPASGAGKNIGMGYNLKANAKTVNEDLKRAGVPEERIGDVVSGRAQMTPMQTQRLLLLTVPRYEKQVQDVADSTSPGLWNKLLPQQKAVMIDVAYQAGSVDKFKKAWAALAAGKAADFQAETKVFYTNRAGERVEDKRRGSLRANMLAGIPQWEALLGKYSAIPANRSEAAALGAKQ